ncbi:MAG: flagellar hook-length control protein FliK [Lachnospiraceae bacterium]|nr:flagellar hook-length control protein FliK [Lachnospiraceae bacterium]
MRIGNIDNEPMQPQQAAVQSADRAKEAVRSGNIKAVAFQPGNNENTILGEKKKSAFPLEEGSAGDVKNKQDMMTLMAHTVSPEAYKRMQEEGFDPAELDPEDAVNIVDGIKATMAKSGVVIAGYNDDLSPEQLEAVTGSAAYAQEIVRSFREQGVPVNEENAAEATETMSRLTGLAELSDGTKDYLIENDLSPTLSNIYLAAHSGAAAHRPGGAGYVQTGQYVGRTASSAESSIPEEQLEAVIGRASEELSEENIALAKAMTERGLPLTEESFRLAKELEELKLPLSVEEAADHCARALSDGMHPSETLLTKKESLLEEAVRISEALQDIPDEAVDAVLAKEQPLNLKNLSAAAKQGAVSASYTQLSVSVELSMESRILTGRRQLQEVRLSMTVQVSYRMLKTGVNVDTTELSELVEQMKAAEEELLKSRYNTQDGETALKRAGLFEDTLGTLRQLPGLPVSILGEFLKADSYESSLSLKSSFSVTMEEYSAAGRSMALRYEAAGERYETMQTTVRTDLGDSLSKAFSRADSLLKELGISADEENLRATRILGYNSMEISEENIDRVKEAVKLVDDITRRMTPPATLQMIREGMNPLKMSMEELDRYLQDAAPTGENYSQFLVRMETKNRITAEERESYIGIYRMLNTVNKRDGAAVGQVLSQDRELSFENLLQAVRSRRDAGMDVTVDDSLQGMKGTVADDIEEQIQTAMYREAQRDLREAADLPAALYEELLENRILPDADTLLGLKGLREKRGEAFDLARRAAGIPHRRQHTAADGRVVTADAAGVSDPLDVTRDILEAKISDTLENFSSREEAQEAYGSMADVAERVLADAAVNDDGSIDLKAMAAAMKQFGAARKLAREESYEIPMRIGGQETSVTVSIRHAEEQRGTADIRLSHVTYGEVHARFTAAGESLKGYVLSDSAAGRDALASMEGELNERFLQEGIMLSGMDFVYSSRANLNFSARTVDEDNESFDTATLYRSAKIFLTLLGEG